MPVLWEKSKISSYSSPTLPGFCVRGNSPEESQTLLTWEIMSFLATMAFVHVLCCMNNTCVRACTHAEKGVIMPAGLRNIVQSERGALHIIWIPGHPGRLFWAVSWPKPLGPKKRVLVWPQMGKNSPSSRHSPSKISEPHFLFVWFLLVWLCVFFCLEEARPIQLQHKPSLQSLGPWDGNWLAGSLCSLPLNSPPPLHHHYNDNQGPKYGTGGATALLHCWCTQLSKDEWLKTYSYYRICGYSEGGYK